ncbi:MAG: hypothetical protein HY917_02175 [Candidatus Diapherotrites archaeon]|nr:hypothetical protein [Candidatus Diapherotrites archaeon]
MFIRFLETRFVWIFLAAVWFGVFFPVFGAFSGITSFLVAVLIFLAALKVDFSEFVSHFHDWKTLLGSLFVLKVIFPVMVFVLLSVLWPSVALAATLFCLLPCGMTNPMVTELFKGKTSLALAFTVVSHLLAPLIIPLVLLAVIGKSVSFDGPGLFSTMAVLVFAPSLLAFAIRKKFTASVLRVQSVLTGASVGVLSIFLLILASVNSAEFLKWPSLLGMMGLIIILYSVLVLVGYFGLGQDRVREERVALSIAAFRFNSSLGLYLSSAFFSPQVTAFMIAAEIAPAMYLLVFERFLKRMN